MYAHFMNSDSKPALTDDEQKHGTGKVAVTLSLFSHCCFTGQYDQYAVLKVTLNTCMQCVNCSLICMWLSEYKKSPETDLQEFLQPEDFFTLFGRFMNINEY